MSVMLGACVGVGGLLAHLLLSVKDNSVSLSESDSEAWKEENGIEKEGKSNRMQRYFHTLRRW
jgi:hypothetical protein